MQDQAKLVRGNNAFAFDLYQALHADQGNLVFSPFSISYALAMTYAGARGETAQQMAATLHFQLPPDQFHPAFGSLGRALVGPAGTPGEASDAALRIANAVWAQDGYSFRPQFLDQLARHYQSALKPADFAAAPEEARQKINHWVAQQTENKVRDLLARGILNPLTRMVLANAIYFLGQWARPFSGAATASRPFHRLDRSTVEAPLMSLASAETFSYRRRRGLQILALPYQGYRLEMVVLLPDEGRFARVQGSLSGGQVEKWVASTRPKLIQLTMPRFRSEAKFSLGRTLADMGMPAAFQDGAADFSGMDGSRELSISHVIHQAFVAVDEAGTEAAAATAVVMAARSMPGRVRAMRLVLDRPFIYLIRDRETGSILFLGHLLDPTA